MIAGVGNRVLVPVVLVAALVTGCGDAESTVELSPLSARLAQIDQSLAAQRFDQARRDLTVLADAVKAARADGELGATGADAILDAIIALKATLPAPVPTSAPSAQPSTTSNNGDEKDAEDGDEEDAEDGAKGKKRGAGKGPKPGRD